MAANHIQAERKSEPRDAAKFWDSDPHSTQMQPAARMIEGTLTPTGSIAIFHYALGSQLVDCFYRAPVFGL
jgi:hypothetical protein